MRIVLATSPGIDKNGNYLIYSPSRWCEGIKRNSRWFAYYPWELGYLSSLLKERTTHEVTLIDGCLERLDKEQYYNRILEQSPDWLIFESSSRTIEESLWVAKRLKNKINTKLIFVGQHPTVYPKKLLQEGVNYVGLGEYEIAVLKLLQGEDPTEIKGIYPNRRKELIDINMLPFPEDRDIKRIDYSYPGEPCAEYREIEVFASRGCPFDCKFCVARNVYYDQPNWRPRNISSVINEINVLKEKYPMMEGVFFNEEVHNGNREFVKNLSKAIINNKLDYFRYEAMCDIRLLDKESISAMKEAGYYKVRVGIESGDRKVLKSINKNIKRDEIKEKLNICKKEGLKTYGTFMFGALGSTLERDKKTVNFLQKLMCNNLLDDAQISISTPQPGTPFYESVKDKHYINTEEFLAFDGGLNSIVDYPEYSSSEIVKMKNLALQRRNRALWKKRIKKLKLWSWIKLKYKKYGFKIFFLKAVEKIVSILNPIVQL